MATYTRYMWSYDGICQVVRIPDEKCDAEEKAKQISHCEYVSAKDLARIKSFKNQTNPHLLQQKSSKQSHFPELEEKLFACFRKIEMQHGVLTDDIVRTKALEIATKMGLTFQASANWVLHFKKRHGIDQKVRHGEGGSADHIYVAMAQAGIPILLRNYNVNPYDCYNMDETAGTTPKFFHVLLRLAQWMELSTN
jgi:hypothetical protein